MSNSQFSAQIALKTNFLDADFWIVRKGSEASLGQVTRDFSMEHIGLKVLDQTVLVPQYLFYLCAWHHAAGLYKPLARGTLRLKHITVEDVFHVLRSHPPGTGI